LLPGSTGFSVMSNNPTELASRETAQVMITPSSVTSATMVADVLGATRLSDGGVLIGNSIPNFSPW